MNELLLSDSLGKEVDKEHALIECLEDCKLKHEDTLLRDGGVPMD